MASLALREFRDMGPSILQWTVSTWLDSQWGSYIIGVLFQPGAAIDRIAGNIPATYGGGGTSFSGGETY